MGLLYQKRRLKVNKIKRQIFSNRVLLHRLRGLLSFILILAITFGCYKILKLPQWYINSSELAKASPNVLKIYGNVITPDYKIINMVRQTQLPYTQIFRLDTTELNDNIAQLQPIKRVYVRRYWFPARLIINVEERTPAFLLAPNLESEPNSALTTDGVLIDHDYLPFNSNIKAKKLLTYGVRDGKDEVWDKKKVETILKLVKALEAYSNQEVQYVDIRNSKDIYVMLEEYLVRLGEINDTSLSRAKWIASILPEAKKYNQKVKYIDLRWDDSYYLRLKDSKTEIKKPKKQEFLKDKKDNKELEENKEQKEIKENKENKEIKEDKKDKRDNKKENSKTEDKKQDVQNDEQ